MEFFPRETLRRQSEHKPLPRRVAEGAEGVLNDLQGNDPITISLSYRPDVGGVIVTVAECSYGFGIDPGAPSAEMLVALAEGIQEHLPECPAAWGEARPACPGHPHPAVAKLVGDSAYWVCPNDGHRLGLIGALH
jgi:hypothetical protein